jgi:hypothetical protein
MSQYMLNQVCLKLIVSVLIMDLMMHMDKLLIAKDYTSFVTQLRVTKVFNTHVFNQV